MSEDKKHDYGPRGKLYCYNWLEDIPGGMSHDDLVEVQFKNTRKGFYRNTAKIPLAIGDMVAVEASPGHDIGEVTLTGMLVRQQMRKANVRNESEIRRIFRKAKPSDLEKYEEAKARENDTMIRSRRIAEELNLNMKIGDVEYQGDGNKAIFYYIADERVDFRKLIKVLADTFKVRIEMKQIGARQEAGRIGGIGPCGRPLCCSSWMTNFVSVATSAARYQDISPNPQKLAGQCAKLKCCLNFEVDAYVEAVKQMPGKDQILETADGQFYFFKSDIFKREITYSTDKSVPANLVTITADRAFEVIDLNKKGEKPLTLLPEGETDSRAPKKEFAEVVGQDSLTRFDKAKKKRKKKKSASSSASADEKQQSADNGSEKQSQKSGNGERRVGNSQKNTGERQKPQQGEPRPSQKSPAQQQKKSKPKGDRPGQTQPIKKVTASMRENGQKSDVPSMATGGRQAKQLRDDE